MGARGIQIGKSFGAIPNKLSDLQDDLDLAGKLNAIPNPNEITKAVTDVIPDTVETVVNKLGLAKASDIPVVTNADYNQTDDTKLSFIKNKPKFKREDVYSGVTSTSGNWVFTFPTPFEAVPNVTPSLPNQVDGNLVVRVTSVTKTGFTINVSKRAVATVLSIEVSLPGLLNQVGVSVDARVREK